MTAAQQCVVAIARDLARRAHFGQYDKAGWPYIRHVSRVAAAVDDDPLAEAVAWLHDVLEDCPEYADEFWRSPPEVAHRVSWLTRIDGHSPATYYARIRKDPVTLRVKLADIADNADEGRLALLDEKTANRLRRKYAKAVAALTGPAE